MTVPLNFLLLLLFSLPLAAAVYKWTDAQGNVQYSQMPPTSTNSTVMSIFPSFSPSPPEEIKKNLEKIQIELNENQTQALAEKNQAQKQAQVTEIKAKNCAQAQLYLNNLNAHARVQIKQLNGQSKWLTPSELATEKALTQEKIREYCSH